MKLLIIFILFAGCHSTESWDLKMIEYGVRYEITGTDSFIDVTLSNYNGGIEQYFDVPIPYVYNFPKTSWDACKSLYLSAQINEPGNITVSIFVNDELIEQSTASGEYSVASAFGVVDSVECY